MKQRTSFTLAAAGIAAMLTFSSCKKDVDYNAGSSGGSSLNSQTRSAAPPPGDRLDAIVKDLSLDSYSFSFDKPIPNGGITRTAYGADNYLAFADPQDLICGDPIKRKYARIPIWRRPNFIWPTCPTMIKDLSKIFEIQQFLENVNPAEFKGIKGIRISNGGALLGTEKLARSYASLQLDKLDALIGGLDPTRFILLGDPDNTKGGAFTRNFYGYADLNSIVFTKYKTNLKDLINPTLKGCFDPLILKAIKDQLVKFNPEIYKGLAVNPVFGDKSIATLSF